MHVIRHPNPGDATDLAALLGQLGYPADAAEVPSRLRAFAPGSHAVAWVAELEGRVVGVATAHVIAAIHKPDAVAMLTALVVAESARGHGIGRALVLAAERWAVEQGASAISLTSAVRRTEAHAFYKRLGYDQTGVRLGRTLR